MTLEGHAGPPLQLGPQTAELSSFIKEKGKRIYEGGEVCVQHSLSPERSSEGLQA